VKNLEYPFEVIGADFGIVGVIAPAYGIPGQFYTCKFLLAKMGLDAKKKDPNVEITMRVLDEAGKALGSKILKRYPRDLPDGVDLSKNNVVQEFFQVYLNRPGQFTIALDAEDKIGKQKSAVRIPLTVLDLAKFGASTK